MYGRMNMHRTRYELRPPPPRETRTRDDPALLCSRLPTRRGPPPRPFAHAPFPRSTNPSPPPLLSRVLFNTRFTAVCATLITVRGEGKERKREEDEISRPRDTRGRGELDSNGKRR